MLRRVPDRGTAGSPRARSGERRNAALDGLLTLQHTAGNAALARILLARQPTQTPAPPPTPASIAAQQGTIVDTQTTTTVTILRPWEIFALVTANTSEKKDRYLALRKATRALADAQKALATADAALAAGQRAAAGPAPPAPARAPAPGGRRRRPPAPHVATVPELQAARDRAVAKVTDAQDKLDEATEKIRDFLRTHAGSLSRLRREEAPILKRLTRDQRALRAEKRTAPAADRRRRTLTAAIATAQADLAAVRLRHKTEIDAVETTIAATHFTPQATTRTTHAVAVDGETITFADNVESWATLAAQGMDEVRRSAAPPTLDSVLTQMTTSASNKKIIRGIVDSESATSPWSAVNTYDRAILTWGMMQWTGGERSDLTAALTNIKASAPAAFLNRFERWGIDVAGNELVVTTAAGTVRGQAAATAIRDSPMLSGIMARAGGDPDIQRAEVATAIEQQIERPLADTISVKVKAHGTRRAHTARITVSDVLTSELLVALFVDRVVNKGRGGAIGLVRAVVQEHLDDHVELDPANIGAWRNDLAGKLDTRLTEYRNRRNALVGRGASATAGSYVP